MAVENDDDVIIICEDDHQFTASYSKSYLKRNIIEAYYQGADILSGGIRNFTQIIPLTRERFWIDYFWGTQFIVLYKKCFSRILSEELDQFVTVDEFLSEISSNKMVIYPFVSIQKDFHFSDIQKRAVGLTKYEVFEKCSNRIRDIMHVFNRYSK
jgi:glycosyl transferase family 25